MGDVNINLDGYKKIEKQGGIYYINKNGKVWNNKTKKFISVCKRKETGKECYNLHFKGKTHPCSIDSLMLEYFPETMEIKSLKGENWKDIVGYEGYYQVSNLGRVKSVQRTIIQSKRKRLLKPVLLSNRKNNGHGYIVVTLCGKDKSQTNHYVHILVANAFMPNIENKKEVNHIDFNKSNNMVENLEWTTRVENINHYRDNIDSHYLEDIEFVGSILKMYRSGMDVNSISNKLNEDYAKIKYIINTKIVL